jgi:hypothetical protein
VKETEKEKRMEKLSFIVADGNLFFTHSQKENLRIFF